jgi:glutathione S-transferase
MGEGAYLTGESLTLADLHVLPHVDYLDYTAEGRSVLAPHARLRAWHARMAAREAVSRAIPKAA